MADPTTHTIPTEKPLDISATERSSFSSQRESEIHDVEAEPKKSLGLVPTKSVDDTVYPKGIKLVLILASIYLAVFLMALVCTLTADRQVPS